MAKGDETREMIVRRAASVFNVRGYFGTSMSDLMRETGLEKGGLYNHFKSKDEIALAAFDYAISLTSERIAEKFKVARHAADRLINIGYVFQSLYEYPTLPGGCPILNTAIESDDTHPELRERARAALDELRDTVKRVVAKGIERGEIRPEVDGDSVATLAISMLEGALMMSKVYGDVEHIRRAVNFLESYVNQNLRA